ncbi:hypothetical protein BN1195_03637 [Chryseobacterium oranimense G311]|nr:hypothetical protein BN1195_03637 [Chryseobacterium oranimense G311]
MEPMKHSKDLEDFKKNYQQRIEDVAKSKTEWIKDFVESQKSNLRLKQLVKCIRK